jgi:gentisate 1,2-dioxygenase
MDAPGNGAIPPSGESVAGAVTPERAAYYSRIGKENLAPLWEVLKGLVPPEPRTPCVPAHWRFNDVRKMLLEAGELITAKEAERRVLVFENPALRGKSRLTQTLIRGSAIDPARRSRAGAPPHGFGDPLRARRGGRLYGGRG